MEILRYPDRHEWSRLTARAMASQASQVAATVRSIMDDGFAWR